MDRDQLLELYSTDDIIELMMEIGSNPPLYDNQKNLIFTTICHCSDSPKLYYYPNTQWFMCYSNCGSLSLYDVVSNHYGIDFKEAYKMLADRKGINLHQRQVGLSKKRLEIDDLDFLKVHLYKPKKNNITELPSYNRCVLNTFDLVYPLDWYEEGISPEVAEYFDIRYCYIQNKAIIPHRDIHGNLVGIRARSYNSYDVANGRKYMPIVVQDVTYRYPMHFNLYGIYENQENIKRVRKVIIMESEKSVMLYASMYGQENNIVVALGGMNLSLYQRDLLLNLGVEEIIFCLDKEYSEEMYENKQSKQFNQMMMYFKKLKKMVGYFINYCSVSLVMCWDDRLNLKDAPIDRGKEVFEELISERYLIDDVEELNDLMD